MSIIIDIGKGATGAPVWVADFGVCRYICKSAIAIVLIELVCTEVGDVKIQVSVIVIIPDGGTGAVGGTPNACLLCDICKGAISVVSVEDVMQCLVLCIACLNCAIDEVDVKVAIAIIIEKTTTGSEEFIEKS